MRVLLSFSFIALISFAHYVHGEEVISTTKTIDVSKKKAVTLAKEIIGGKTLKITEKIDCYTVRILKDDGHVVDLHINKKTGEVNED